MSRLTSTILVVAVTFAALAGKASAQAITAAPAAPPAYRLVTPEPPAPPAPPVFRLATIGPPAPVPPEVAMLRPDGAELQQMNGALRRFIDNDKSDASAALKKYQSLILVPPP